MQHWNIAIQIIFIVYLKWFSSTVCLELIPLSFPLSLSKDGCLFYFIIMTYLNKGFFQIFLNTIKIVLSKILRLEMYFIFLILHQGGSKKIFQLARL
jgi:hypothetical protein